MHWSDEDYKKAVGALYRRVERQGYIWQQPNASASTIDKKGVITLRTGDVILGQYDTKKGRLIRES